MRILSILLMVLLLNACVSRPTPEVAGHVAESTDSLGLVTETTPSPVSMENVDSLQTFDFRALHRSIDSLLFIGDSLGAVSLLRQQVQKGNNLDELGKRCFLLANLLHKLGRDQEALDVIGGFVAYKPSVLEWMDRSDSLERIIRGEQRESVLDLQPLVKQISNFMSTSGDYVLVRELTDSLRSQKLPDSLRTWSHTQDSIALRRTCTKLAPRLDSIRKWVRENGDYGKARESLGGLSQLKPELVAALGLDAVVQWVEQSQAKEKETQLPGFWKGKDPKKVWENAKEYVRARNYEKALNLYRQLQTSNLRKLVLPELQALGESFCQQKRQIAADEFSRAKNESNDPAKIRLQKAIQALNTCLAEFPDYTSAAKVRQNKDMLEKELERRSP